MVITSAVGATAPRQNAVAKAFQKRLYDSIGTQWYARMEAHRRELTPGTTRVSLVLSRDGTIRKLRVVSNTSDERVATLVLDAIKHAKLPKPPAEILKHDVFESGMKFTVNDALAAPPLDPSKIDNKITIMPGQTVTVQFQTHGGALKAPRIVEQPTQKQPSITLDFGKHDAKLMLHIQNGFPQALHVRCLMRLKGQTTYSETRFGSIPAGTGKYDAWDDPVAELVLFDFRLSK